MYSELTSSMAGSAHSQRPGMNNPNRMPATRPMKIASVMLNVLLFFPIVNPSVL